MNNLPVFEWEHSAMNGEPVPERLDIAETYAYMALKELYAMYKAGLITRKEAQKDKEAIVYNMADAKSKLEFLNRQALTLSDRIREASEHYKSEPTIENADRLYAAFWNVPDDWRLKGETNE